MTTPTPITRPMYRVLGALNDASAKGGLTRKKIAELAFGGNSVNLKVLLDPLAKAKLVNLKDIDVEGKTETLVTITAAGKKVAKNPPQVRETTAAHAALPKVGGVIEKTYLGKAIKVTVVADGFKFGGKTYPSLTAAAKAVRGTDQEVNGWKFFGLVKTAAKE